MRWASVETFLAIVEGCKVENGERAAMLNAVDNAGESVLHQAVRFGFEGKVDFLLSEKGREAGFNPDHLIALTNGKESVLFLAVSRISVACLDRILGQCRNAEERCRLLFGVDFRGWTVLHRAVDIGRLPIVEWVVTRQQEERGGSNEDLFVFTNNKESALHLAAEEGHVECFDFLLSRCNNTSERLRLFLGRDSKGRTFFSRAARNNKGMFIAHILRKYPDESKMIINARDNRGMTVMHRTIVGGIDEESRREWAARPKEKGKRVVLRALLRCEEPEGGADPNVGWTLE